MSTFIMRHKQLFSKRLNPILLILILLLGAALVAQQINKVEASRVTATNPQISTSNRVNRVSAATALSNGQPTLFFFNPEKMCQIKYCLTADWVESKLAVLSDQVNFVVVPVHPVAQTTAESPPPFPVLDWDIYPVNEVTTWLPELSLTSEGWGLWEPALVLVNAEGQVLHQSYSWDAEAMEQLIAR